MCNSKTHHLNLDLYSGATIPMSIVGAALEFEIHADLIEHVTCAKTRPLLDILSILLGEPWSLSSLVATFGATYRLDSTDDVIGTLRRELLDYVPFSGATDLERKLAQFRDYYNQDRVHASLDGLTPICKTTAADDRSVISLKGYQWRSHCRGLYHLPAAA